MAKKAKRLLDHSPLILDLTYELRFDTQANTRVTRWDLDMLADLATSGEKKDAFLRAVEDAVRPHAARIRTLANA